MALPAWYHDDNIRQRLNRVSTATLTTQLFKRGLRTRFMAGVHPIRTGRRMLGVARTLRYVPMREDLDTLDTLGSRDNAQRALIETIEPGEVLVVDGLRNQGAGSLGSILALRLHVRGATGIVTDGAFRDTPGIRQLDIPAYAAGQNANTNLTIYHPVDFDLAIGCGGVLVEPGDAIVGDDEGVVVIPLDMVEDVARESFEQDVRERYIFDLVRRGASVFEVYPMNHQVEAEYTAWRGSLHDEAVLNRVDAAPGGGIAGE